MKRNIPLLLPAILFVIVTVAQTPVKKYDIRSGIVTYELNMKVGGMEIRKKTVVYFDDYGMKECRETYSNSKLEESYFSDGKELYSVRPNKKTAFRRGTAYRGTELRVDKSEFGTEADRRSDKFKTLPPMLIAGKSCETFEYNDGKGSVTRYGGWNKILMYLDVKTKSTQTIQKAVKVEENARVSSEKFKVPAGFVVQ